MRCVCLFFVPFLSFFWPARWLFRDGLFHHTERRNWPVHYIFLEGNIDLDRLYNAARTRVDGKKIPLTIPVIGELRFDVNDVDWLYKYIQEA